MINYDGFSRFSFIDVLKPYSFTYEMIYTHKVKRKRERERAEHKKERRNATHTYSVTL